MEAYLWIFALLAGLLLGWLIGALRAKAQSGASREEFEAVRGELESVAQEKVRLDERVKQLDTGLEVARQELDSEREAAGSLASKLAASEERQAALTERLDDQKKELEQLQEKMRADFENLANKILDEKSKKFVTQNQESLDKLLAPLGEKIVSFREKVETTREQDIKDRAALVEQLKALGDLNRKMSEEAQNLTTALKGQTKTQGNWGELILENVLEKSGLVKGQEYETQVSVTDEQGKRYQPDVLVKLPDDKRLIVDAKVSLVAYERCVNEDNTDGQHLKEHVASMKNHVSELSKKSYESLYGINAPDFVLMFVPIEPAFTMAMQADDTLFDYAFQQNVVLVTPSTLLATLRTVANIWRQEKQTRNVLEIARKSGALYDKFVGFYADMEQVGERIRKSQEAHEEAMKKLKSGRGNLVRSVEEIKKLGARAKKSLPPDSVEEALLDETS